jgi:ribokinase
MDLVVKAPRLPARGETILGENFLMTPGGKGANQAVAAAKLGAEVYFIAKLGKDIFGQKSLQNFKKAGVNTQYITQTNSPSGVALITVDDTGGNEIVVASGANQKLSLRDIKGAVSAIASSAVLVVQLEVPMKTVEFAAQLAHNYKLTVILDPAPAQKLSPELLKIVDCIKPNETEAQILTDIEVINEASARKAADHLLKSGVKAVILTMGAKGFLFATTQKTQFVPAIEVTAVDTTAAGDAFTGGLAFGLAEGQNLFDAAMFANYVAALSVTKMGAQSSMPARQAVEGFIKKTKLRRE